MWLLPARVACSQAEQKASGLIQSYRATLRSTREHAPPNSSGNGGKLKKKRERDVCGSKPRPLSQTVHNRLASSGMELLIISREKKKVSSLDPPPEKLSGESLFFGCSAASSHLKSAAVRRDKMHLQVEGW